MSVNISHLGDLKPSEPVDLSTYTGQRASGGFRPLPTPGRYTVRAPEFTDNSFTVSKAGALLTDVAPTIVGGDYDGYQIRFASVSAKTFQRTEKVNGEEVKVTASGVADYLKALGRTETVPEEPKDVANLIATTAGQTYDIETDWKVWDGANQVEYTLSKNPERFDQRDDNGTLLPYILAKDASGEVIRDENGNVKRLRVKVVIKKFIAASA